MSFNVSSTVLEYDTRMDDKQSLAPYFYIKAKDLLEKYFNAVVHTSDVDLSPTGGELAPESYVESLFLNFSLVSDAGEVVSFLYENSFLLPIIQEARNEVEKYFKDVKKDLRLRLFEDPETGGKKIILVIMVSMSTDEALERFEALRQGWWLKVFGKTQWKMSVDIDFV